MKQSPGFSAHSVLYICLNSTISTAPLSPALVLYGDNLTDHS
jgi:hypothetical protein